jgi:hypothetical protein
MTAIGVLHVENLSLACTEGFVQLDKLAYTLMAIMQFSFQYIFGVLGGNFVVRLCFIAHKFLTSSIL